MSPCLIRIIKQILFPLSLIHIYLDLVPEIELSSNDLLIDLARIGLGIAFVPDFCIPADESQLYILKLAQSLPARKLVVASNDSVPLSQAAKQFMDML